MILVRFVGFLVLATVQVMAFASVSPPVQLTGMNTKGFNLSKHKNPQGSAFPKDNNHRYFLSRSTSTSLNLHILSSFRGGAAATAASERGNSLLSLVSEWNKSPTSLFNTCLVLLALVTAVFKVIQRQETLAASKKSGIDSTSSKPNSIVSLQRQFLAVFWLLRCADWLQGPYFYEVYASKIINGAQASMSLVSQLFLTGFASTALFGPYVGRATDNYGRKKGTLAFSIIYALGAISTKSPLFKVLFLGRILSGIGTSLLFSAPESWLVGESRKSGDDPEGKYLGETFGMVWIYYSIESVTECLCNCLYSSMAYSSHSSTVLLS